MKKIILITIVAIFATTTQAQTYTPWSQFANDTLAYLKTNFDTNGARYAGQPLEKVINDFELPILHTTPVSSNYKTRVKSIMIYSISGIERNYRSDNRLPFHTMYIFLREPSPSYEYYIKNQSKEGDIATRARFDAMLFKDNIVDSIRVYTIKYEPQAPAPQRTERSKQYQKPTKISDIKMKTLNNFE